MISEQDVNQWVQFIQDRWWVILISLVALLLVISLVRTVLKWLLAAVIVAVVLIYGANYTEELSAFGDKMIDEAKEQAFQALVSGALDAQYEKGEDGAFAVYTESLRVEGAEGSDEVTLYWKGIRIGTFKVDATIQAFLDEAKRSQ